MPSLKRRIEETLKPIIGEPLSDMWRYAGFQVFEFGIQRPAVNRKGQPITRSDWALGACCTWSICGTEGRVLSSEDFGPDGERHDEAAAPFYQLVDDSSLIVRAIEVGERAQVRFVLSQGFALDIVLDSDDPQEDQWHFHQRDRRGTGLMVNGGANVWPP